MNRFDVVVLNYNRIGSFTSCFPGRIKNFRSDVDRITVLSCSPSLEESQKISEFERDQNVRIRYLTRRNRGIDQLARAEYFSGSAGCIEENLKYRWIFQMQDHYLDIDATYSRWGSELSFQVKGDVVPDGVCFDLDAIDAASETLQFDTAFADRHGGCWFQRNGIGYIAPSGGNYIVSTSLLRDSEMQAQIRRLIRSYDGTYRWAVYAEFLWGFLFFRPGARTLDISSGRTHDEFPQGKFYVSPDPVDNLFRRYFQQNRCRRTMSWCRRNANELCNFMMANRSR